MFKLVVMKSVHLMVLSTVIILLTVAFITFTTSLSAKAAPTGGYLPYTMVHHHCEKCGHHAYSVDGVSSYEEHVAHHIKAGHCGSRVNHPQHCSCYSEN